MANLYRDPQAPPARACRVMRAAVPAGPLVDAAGWPRADRIEWGPVAYRTGFSTFCDAHALAIRFDCTDDRPWHTMTERDAPLWEEEVVEIFLDPAREGHAYAELEINPANVVCDLRVLAPWPELRADRGWNWDGLETEVHRFAGGWTAMARLPFAGLASLSPDAAAAVPPRPGDRWHFNVFRIKRPHGPAERERDALYAAWSVPDGPSFHVPAFFRELIFD